MNVYQSRWGYHPCDFETYLLLKQLHGLYEKALHAQAAWSRRARKLPQNRVIRRYRRNEKGEKIGCDVIGPMPEPRLSRLFCTKTHVVNPAQGSRIATRVAFDSLRVPEVYRAARTPAPTAEAVTPLLWTPEEIRRMIAQAKEEC